MSRQLLFLINSVFPKIEFKHLNSKIRPQFTCTANCLGRTIRTWTSENGSIDSLDQKDETSEGSSNFFKQLMGKITSVEQRIDFKKSRIFSY